MDSPAHCCFIPTVCESTSVSLSMEYLYGTSTNNTCMTLPKCIMGCIIGHIPWVLMLRMVNSFHPGYSDHCAPHSISRVCKALSENVPCIPLFLFYWVMYLNPLAEPCCISFSLRDRSKRSVESSTWGFCNTRYQSHYCLGVCSCIMCVVCILTLAHCQHFCSVVVFSFWNYWAVFSTSALNLKL